MEISHYVTTGAVKISTPGITDLSAVKAEVLEQTPDHIIHRLTYPNALEVVIQVNPDGIHFYSNRPLQQLQDGSLVLPVNK